MSENVSDTLFMIQLAGKCGFHEMYCSLDDEFCFYHSLEDHSVRTDWFHSINDAIDFFINQYRKKRNNKRR